MSSWVLPRFSLALDTPWYSISGCKMSDTHAALSNYDAAVALRAAQLRADVGVEWEAQLRLNGQRFSHSIAEFSQQRCNELASAWLRFQQARQGSE